ncbi:hypothetical protein ACTXT7_004681 [Hymenolepis weldensis]
MRYGKAVDKFASFVDKALTTREEIPELALYGLKFVSIYLRCFSRSLAFFLKRGLDDVEIARTGISKLPPIIKYHKAVRGTIDLDERRFICDIAADKIHIDNGTSD